MKQVGDEVAVGDELVEIETDKANMAYESDVAGTLTEILAEEGDTLPIGAPIAVVGDPGDGNGAAPAKESAPAETSPTDTPAGASSSNAGEPPPPEYPQEGITPAPAPPAGVSVGERRIKASPVAKRIAKDTGVDLSTLTGSGPGGRIVKADVEGARAAAPRRPRPPASSAAPPCGRRGRGCIGERPPRARPPTRSSRVSSRSSRGGCAESKATAPHFYLQTEIDMSAAVEARGGSRR